MRTTTEAILIDDKDTINDRFPRIKPKAKGIQKFSIGSDDDFTKN